MAGRRRFCEHLRGMDADCNGIGRWLGPARLGTAAALAAVLCHQPASAAANDCKGPSEDCVVVGKWNFSLELGVGVRTNPLVNGKNIPLDVIPHVSYYGKKFFLNDLEAGYTLIENDTVSFNLVAAPDYDRVFFYRTDPQNFFITSVPAAGLPVSYTTDGGVAEAAPGSVKVPPRSRRLTYLAGPEVTFRYSGVSGQLDVLREITGQNQGDEVRAAIGIPLTRGKGALTADVGFTWQSSSIVNYYYGETGIYGGASALDPFLELRYTRPLSRKWRFNAFAEYERLGNAIANSPIVAEHGVATVFMGAIYTW